MSLSLLTIILIVLRVDAVDYVKNLSSTCSAREDLPTYLVKVEDQHIMVKV
jgi:hypothetical protein